jgi:hypothetical protein
MPETYEELENWEVNIAPDSEDGDDEGCEGFDDETDD